MSSFRRSGWSVISGRNSAAFAFEAYRYRPTGRIIPDFVLNQPRYRDAKIMVAGENFGCGSSRESAVWAMAGFGFRCVIAPSFGDIFTNNAFQNRMLLIRLPKEQVERLAAEIEDWRHAVHEVDLQKQDHHGAVRCRNAVRGRRGAATGAAGRPRRDRHDAGRATRTFAPSKSVTAPPGRGSIGPRRETSRRPRLSAASRRAQAGMRFCRDRRCIPRGSSSARR